MIRIALGVALGAAALFGFDAWCRHLTETSESARQFILSDNFWLAVAGGAITALGAILAVTVVLTFNPSRSGRTGPEGDA